VFAAVQSAGKRHSTQVCVVVSHRDAAAFPAQSFESTQATQVCVAASHAANPVPWQLAALRHCTHWPVLVSQ